MTAEQKNSTSERIDSHHHLWRYSVEEFPWITPDMGGLKRDFMPQDLLPELQRSRVTGAVVVQARQTLEETRWLLDCARSTAWIRGVVGWAPVATVNFAAILDELLQFDKLKGLRHVIQDEPDDFILGGDFNAGLASMLGTGLVYDVLIHERQLPNAAEFVRRHPQQVFVLDHLAKPRVSARRMEPWRSNLKTLAVRQNVFCKVSGLTTEADWANWTTDELEPFLDAALEAFGPERLMVGSDWPVCLLATTYSRWWDAVQEWAQCLSAAEQDALLGGTATEVYRLDESDRI